MSEPLKSILEEDLFCDVLCSDKVLVTDQKALAERVKLLSEADAFVCDFSTNRQILLVEIGAAITKKMPIVFHGAFNSLSNVTRADLELILPDNWNCESHFTQTNITLKALDDIKQGLQLTVPAMEHQILAMPNVLIAFLNSHLLMYSDKVRFRLPTDEAWGVKFKVSGRLLVVKAVEKDRQDICKFRCGDVVYAAENKVLINSHTSGGQVYDYLANLKHNFMLRSRKEISQVLC